MMLQYSAEIFIDRKEELDLLLNVTSSLSTGELAHEQRVVHVAGKAGIGKSWLLQKYYTVLSHESKFFLPIYIDLKDYASLPIDEFSMELLRKIDGKVSKDLGISSPFLNPVPAAVMNVAQAYARWILRALELLQKEKAVVLLLDEVDRLSTEQIEVLEDYLLGGLLSFSKSVLVLAGRRLVTGWREFGLRPSTDFNVVELLGFDLEQTERQVVSKKPDAKHMAETIFEIGGGSPRNTDIILNQLAGDPPKIVTYDAIRACNQELYFAVDDVSKGIPRELASELLPSLEAICVLQDFDKDYEVPPLLAAHNSLAGVWDAKRVSAIFSILSSIQIGPGRLLGWNSSGHAYAMEEQTRVNLERELELRDRDLWAQLHCTAMKMYKQWATEYGSEIFATKAGYHEARLLQAGIDPKICEPRG